MDKKGVHFMAEENKEIVVIDETTIKSKIYYIRNQKVMLDFELAEIYGYETKTFNQQVKNNIEKFDEDFRFQLTKDEWEFLRSKFLTSKSDEGSGGRRYMPYAFTEQGLFEFSNNPCSVKAFGRYLEPPQLEVKFLHLKFSNSFSVS